jgi:hypothetical protein
MDPNDPWAMPPLAAKGDPDLHTVWRAVGEALSYWEWLEGYLSLIFCEMVSPKWSFPAHRAYGSVISFNGRADMLRNAAEAYFVTQPDAELQEKLNGILKVMSRASPRRNDIAHGIAQPHYLGGPMRGFVLYPAFYSTNRRNNAGHPKYGMTSVEIGRFAEQFKALHPSIIGVQDGFTRRRMRRS